MGVCANCGHPNPDIAKFCEKCGSRLTEPPKGQQGSDPVVAPGASAMVPSIKTEGPTPDMGQTQRVPRVATAAGQKPPEPEPASSEPTTVSVTSLKQAPGRPPELPKKRRSRKPLIFGCVAALLLVCCGGGFAAAYFGGLSLESFTGSGSDWSTASTTISQVLDVDLSSLGLQKVDEVNKDQMGNFQQAVMAEARQDVYKLNNASDPTVGITALKYADRDVAGSDFQALIESPTDPKNSTKSVNTLSHTGTANFEFAGSFERLQWNDYWIIHVVVLKEQAQDAAGLRDKIWNKMDEHLKTIK